MKLFTLEKYKWFEYPTWNIYIYIYISVCVCVCILVQDLFIKFIMVSKIGVIVNVGAITIIMKITQRETE